MLLKILGSSSRGNAYILENEREALLIECGVPFFSVKWAVGFNISKIAGCLLTHEHKDHSLAASEVVKNRIPLYCSNGTWEAISKSEKLKKVKHGVNILTERKPVKIGGFTVLPFSTTHNAAEPMGFIINHKETGSILFATDTRLLPYAFTNVDNIMLECNHSESIIDERIKNGEIDEATAARSLANHMSIETLKDALVNDIDISTVKSICLLHLSAENANARAFAMEIKELTGKTVFVAKPGLEVGINKC